MKNEYALRSTAMTIIGLLIAASAAQAKPPQETLDKLAGKKADQIQKEAGRGSEQGQLSRENRMKWWLFEPTQPEEPAPPEEPEEPAPPEGPEEPPTDGPPSLEPPSL